MAATRALALTLLIFLLNDAPITLERVCLLAASRLLALGSHEVSDGRHNLNLVVLLSCVVISHELFFRRHCLSFRGFFIL